MAEKQSDQKPQIDGPSLRRTSAKLRSLEAKKATVKRAAPISNKVGPGRVEKKRKIVKAEVEMVAAGCHTEEKEKEKGASAKVTETLRFHPKKTLDLPPFYSLRPPPAPPPNPHKQIYGFMMVEGLVSLEEKVCEPNEVYGYTPLKKGEFDPEQQDIYYSCVQAYPSVRSIILV